jgi:hypothetical protein
MMHSMRSAKGKCKQEMKAGKGMLGPKRRFGNPRPE